MKKIITVLLIMLTVSMTALAEENSRKSNDEVNFIPLLKYDYLNLESQNIHSTSAGTVIKSEDVMFVGLYTRHLFKDSLYYDYPEVNHTIDVLLDGKEKRHQYLGILKSESDEPVYSGLRTFQAAAVYGYELYRSRNFSLVLGGGLAVGDFGFERENGEPWPVIPVPLIRANYKTDWIKCKFEFITGPNFELIIGPKSHVRFITDVRMDQLRDSRDLIFESSLAYRFFPSESEMGDFAGISVGFKNDNYGEFNIGGQKDEFFELHYYSVFGAIDISLVKLAGGYTFGGRELFRHEHKKNIGEGYFLSIQALYQF